jgi:hypothetical protein
MLATRLYSSKHYVLSLVLHTVLYTPFRTLSVGLVLRRAMYNLSGPGSLLFTENNFHLKNTLHIEVHAHSRRTRQNLGVMVE